MKPSTHNLFENIPEALSDEYFQTLWKTDKIKIERIVSRGHYTPEGQWYDQDWDEWVLLAQGKANLIFDNGDCIAMKPGDYLMIPAHSRHRVEWTAPDEDTVWLALHFNREQG